MASIFPTGSSSVSGHPQISLNNVLIEFEARYPDQMIKLEPVENGIYSLMIRPIQPAIEKLGAKAFDWKTLAKGTLNDLFYHFAPRK